MDTKTTLRRLEVFCLVVETGGVTRAAEALHVAQPAVSVQLRTLERSLGGVDLFDRRGNRLFLTEFGEHAYTWAKKVLAGASELQRTVDDLAAGRAGSLVIHSSMAVGTYLLPRVLGQLRAERPGADITLHSGEPATAWRAAEIGEADFAVCTMLPDADVPTGLEAVPLCDAPITLCVGPSGPALGEKVDVAALMELPFVAAPVGIAFDQLVSAQLRAAGVSELNVMLRLGHAEAIKQSAIDNNWVCLLPDYVVADDVRDGRLRSVTVSDAELFERVGVYHTSDKRFSSLQQAALDALQELVPG